MSHPQARCFCLSVPKPQFELRLNTKRAANMSEASSQATPGFMWFFPFQHSLSVIILLCLPKVLISIADQRHHFSSLSVGILPGYLGQDWSFSSHCLSYLSVFTEPNISPDFFKMLRLHFSFPQPGSTFLALWLLSIHCLMLETMHWTMFYTWSRISLSLWAFCSDILLDLSDRYFHYTTQMFNNNSLDLLKNQNLLPLEINHQTDKRQVG